MTVEEGGGGGGKGGIWLARGFSATMQCDHGDVSQHQQTDLQIKHERHAAGSGAQRRPAVQHFHAGMCANRQATKKQGLSSNSTFTDSGRQL